MVECLSAMVLVSAAAVSSLFLATAAFFRGFTDPTPVRRSTQTPRPFKASTERPTAALGLRLHNVVDPLDEEASSQTLSSHSSSDSPTFGSTSHHHDSSLFPARFDNIDLERILSNRRLVRNYVGCMVNTKPCTAEGKEIRRALPDALLTECAKCSEHMKHNFIRAVQVLQREYPHEWSLLTRHFDPDGGYRRRYKQYIEHTESEKLTNVSSTAASAA